MGPINSALRAPDPLGPAGTKANACGPRTSNAGKLNFQNTKNQRKQAHPKCGTKGWDLWATSPRVPNICGKQRDAFFRKKRIGRCLLARAKDLLSSSDTTHEKKQTKDINKQGKQIQAAQLWMS